MTTLHRTRQPDTKLTRACPEYAAAIADFERALSRLDEPGIEAAWARAASAAEAFRQGAEFARVAGGRV